MNLQSIKMIAFDLFGVVLTEGHLISSGLMPLLPSGIERKQVKALYESFNIAQIGESEFWSFSDGIDPARIKQALFDGLKLDPDFDSVTQSLQQHYELSILSNVPAEWADVLLQQFILKDTFAHCLFSGHLHCKKPDSEIYQKLIEQSGYSAAEILFIDDRLVNLQTASELGMTTVYFQRENDRLSYIPDFTINRLSSLQEILVLPESLLQQSG